MLPEFFTTGMGFLDRIADAALPPDGAATQLLRRLARRHRAIVGGSFICRDPDGDNRNAFFLVRSDGEVAGRHDKDIPTMWENCFYVGGSDDGVMTVGALDVGAALCWEFMRSGTARRLRGRVDLVVGGSAWWSMPVWPPKAVSSRLEASNARNAGRIAQAMARHVGAPVVHAAVSGPVECPIPLAPLTYRGHAEGGALVCDAEGRVLAHRHRRRGPGLAVAELEPGRREPGAPIPDRFWLHRRGLLPAAIWTYQNAHGRLWYRRHGRDRPTAAVELPREPASSTPAPDEAFAE